MDSQRKQNGYETKIRDARPAGRATVKIRRLQLHRTTPHACRRLRAYTGSIAITRAAACASANTVTAAMSDFQLPALMLADSMLSRKTPVGPKPARQACWNTCAYASPSVRTTLAAGTPCNRGEMTWTAQCQLLCRELNRDEHERTLKLYHFRLSTFPSHSSHFRLFMHTEETF